ncbi:MAG: hypothetical protein IK005_03700 [Paludibacteraceae bacterium]|nr:hypothetical protein [Paludibacteraceae bacterium]
MILLGVVAVSFFHDTQASNLIPRRDRQLTAPVVQSVTNRAGFQPI